MVSSWCHLLWFCETTTDVFKLSTLKNALVSDHFPCKKGQNPLQIDPLHSQKLAKLLGILGICRGGGGGGCNFGLHLVSITGSGLAAELAKCAKPYENPPVLKFIEEP